MQSPGPEDTSRGQGLGLELEQGRGLIYTARPRGVQSPGPEDTSRGQGLVLVLGLIARPTG